MTKSESKSVSYGAKLMTWLDEEANERNMNYTDVAKYLGISRPYFYALRRGQRDTRNMDRELIKRIATFLKRPVIAVYVGAGILDLADFHHPDDEMMALECERAIKFIRNDAQWGHFQPLEENLSLNTKLFIVKAYQAATGRVLINENSSSGKNGTEAHSFSEPNLSP